MPTEPCHIALPDTPGLDAVLAALPQARLVGGAVRDALAGLTPGDIDLATPEPPEAVIRRLEDAGLRAVPTGLAHGTVTAVSAGRGFEVTTLRRDLRADGRHAEVAWTADWAEDAARRDFTINAMSAGRDGVVFDYFGGIDDLRQGRIRFVGSPAARLAEDYLRALRFFRFYARFGRMAPDALTLAALRAAAGALGRLSAERVWAELRGLLAVAAPLPALRLMDECGVLDAILPGGGDLTALAALLDKPAPADPLLRLAALLRGDAAQFASALRLSHDEATRLEGPRQAPLASPEDDDHALRRLLAEHNLADLAGRIWLSGLNGPASAALVARLSALPKPVFPLSGRDGLALGATPGPALGAALAAVRSWWLAGGCTADPAACREELRTRLQAPGGPA